ncbi:MAG: NAD-dependent DNA ligase LigA [Thermoanaerobaculales bacterium]|nr:NAD-dependent DNA ligase LigA [Thermoanaerobaculales bacterium]
MTGASLRDRIEDLRRRIRHHDRLYYGLGQSEISDFEYDQLFAELRALEDANPEFAADDSPTLRVGGEPLTALTLFRHEVPMLSLDNTYSTDELRAWYDKIGRRLGRPPAALAAELKIDGVSIGLHYEEGRLIRAVTRGDGEVGDDVTANARTIRCLPLMLKDGPRRLEVRGEVYMPRSVFVELNSRRRARDEAEFANPRNAAAGAIRLLDSKETSRRRLALWCYQLVRAEDFESGGHVEDLESLARWGLPVSPGVSRCECLEEIEALISKWGEERAGFDFETDGVVVKVDRREEREVLGATARAVRWAVAFKYPPEGRTTRVEDLVVQVGRTGVLTPVAVLEPVLLAGSTVSRATLHNFDEVERLDVRVGDLVWVAKGGEVIPKVVGVVTSARPADSAPTLRPTHCPVCDREVSGGEGEVALRCVNADCPAVTASRLRHFVSRGAMEIEGLGGRSLDLLVEQGMVKDAASLWDLQKEELASLPKWGEVSAGNLMEELDGARTRPLHRLIFALGISHVGERAARSLAVVFPSIADLASAEAEKLEAIEGVGSVMAASIVFWFSEEANQTLIERLVERGVNPVEAPSEPVGSRERPLEGKVFVLTGTLSISRREMKNRLEALGATVTGSVSRKTSFVLAGQDPGAKVKRANELGVDILDEEALDILLRERSGE